MKKFLIRTSFFIIFFIAAICTVFLVNRNFSNFKTVEPKTMLVIGDSHSECAFNDSLVNGLVNFSQAGESYFYSYFKIKMVIDQNPNIKTLLIEISNNQVKKDTDRRIWGDKYLPFKFPVYGAFMDVKSIELLMDNNPEGFRSSIFPLIKSNTKMIFKGLDYKEEIGGYHYLTTTLKDSIAEYDAFDDDLIPSKNDRSASNNPEIFELEYLRKIMHYGESKGLQVFLVRSPLNEKYQGFENEKLFKDKLESAFPEIELLDFAYFPLSNEQFADLSHLNYKGAKRFSLWFNKLIDQGLFEQSNKQKFINQEMNSTP